MAMRMDVSGAERRRLTGRVQDHRRCVQLRERL
jgi:hypothetical protein